MENLPKALLSLYGCKIVTSKFAVTKVWEFPKEKFVEFEKSDEWWCRKYGVGKEVLKPSMYTMFDNTIVIHPDIYSEFLKRIKV